MSVTFYCPDAPVSQETNERISPEVNWSSTNAANILRLLGVDPGEDYCHGELLPEDIGALRNYVLRIRTSPIPHSFMRPTTDSIGEKGARIISIGNTKEDIYRRLDQLAPLLVWADAHKMKVVWG